MKRYLARKIDAFLVEWKADKNKKPLLIKGARQIGKTEAVRHFATAHYRYFHEINFVLRPEFKQIVEDGYSVAAIIKRISFIEPEWRFEAGHTLLFFDSHPTALPLFLALEKQIFARFPETKKRVTLKQLLRQRRTRDL